MPIDWTAGCLAVPVCLWMPVRSCHIAMQIADWCDRVAIVVIAFMTTATEPTETRNWSHAVASAFSFVFYPILAEVGGGNCRETTIYCLWFLPHDAMLAQSYGSNSNIRELRQSRDLIFAIEEASCDRSPKCMFKTVFLSPFPPIFYTYFCIFLFAQLEVVITSTNHSSEVYKILQRCHGTTEPRPRATCIQIRKICM